MSNPPKILHFSGNSLARKSEDVHGLYRRHGHSRLRGQQAIRRVAASRQ